MNKPYSEDDIVKKLALTIAAGATLLVAVAPALADNIAGRDRDAVRTPLVTHSIRDANAHMHHHHGGWHHSHRHHHHWM